MSSNVEAFTAEEEEILKPHFSNTNRNVFAIITPKQVDRGALMSRYSRTNMSMRRIFLKEFANNPNRGEEFYSKVLGDYGDDSVAELGEAQIAVENVSNIVVKLIEDRRLGLSYLEKSSRYVDYGVKQNGRWQYFLEPTLMNSNHAETFVNACNLDFEFYTKNLEPMRKFLRETRPIEGEKFFDSETKSEVLFGDLKTQDDIKVAKSAYDNSIKAKSTDILRVVLPAATTTNVGVTGNGRAFEYLLSILYSSRLAEARNVAKEIHQELGTVIGSFVKRADDKYGKSLQEYLRSTEAEVKKHVEAIGSNQVASFGGRGDIDLIHYDDNETAEKKVVEAILFPESSYSLAEIHEYVNRVTPGKRKEIIDDYTKHRTNRRHRPGRAFEATDYTFNMITDFGIFRDLHRHRVLTLERQKLSTDHGYVVPQEIIEAGMEKDFNELMDNTADAYGKIKSEFPEEAQYVVNYAHRYNYFLKMNLREATHLIELRTGKAGHPAYRKACQDMYTHIKNAHPNLAAGMKYVDMNTYGLERIDQQKKLERKHADLVGKENV